MASGSITSLQRDGEKVKTVSDFILLDSKINADGDYSHKIKRHLFLGRIVTTNLEKVKVKVKSLSYVRLFATPWTVAYQAPRSMGFSRQEYQSELPFR